MGFLFLLLMGGFVAAMAMGVFDGDDGVATEPEPEPDEPLPTVGGLPGSDAAHLADVEGFFASYTTTATNFDFAGNAATGSDANDLMVLDRDIDSYYGGAGDDFFDLDNRWADDADSASLTGGEGRDIYGLDLGGLTGDRVFEITDFNPEEDVLVAYGLDQAQLESLEAAPDPDGAHTDLTFKGAEGTVTFRLTGLAEYDPNQVVFSLDTRLVSGDGRSPNDGLGLTAPMDWDNRATDGGASVGLFDDRYVTLGAGRDIAYGDGGGASASNAVIDLGAGDDDAKEIRGDVTILAATATT